MDMKLKKLCQVQLMAGIDVLWWLATQVTLNLMLLVSACAFLTKASFASDFTTIDCNDGDAVLTLTDRVYLPYTLEINDIGVHNYLVANLPYSWDGYQGVGVVGTSSHPKKYFLRLSRSSDYSFSSQGQRGLYSAFLRDGGLDVILEQGATKLHWFFESCTIVD